MAQLEPLPNALIELNQDAYFQMNKQDFINTVDALIEAIQDLNNYLTEVEPIDFNEMKEINHPNFQRIRILRHIYKDLVHHFYNPDLPQNHKNEIFQEDLKNFIEGELEDNINILSFNLEQNFEYDFDPNNNPMMNLEGGKRKRKTLKRKTRKISKKSRKITKKSKKTRKGKGRK